MTSTSKKMLLMGSSVFKRELPFEVAAQIDWAVEGGCRLLWVRLMVHADVFRTTSPPWVTWM